ncbi:MAG: polymerase, beta-like region [Flavipsychrobacter sp.]|nr:polymerase, beta-like region [Flavipsychrobacter sp.]
MIPLIQNNIQAIRELCKKHHVKTFYLVGSAAKEGRFSDNSDVDFLYRFKNEEIEEFDHVDNFFDLLFALQDLLNRKVDLVSEAKMKNPYFIKSINESKQIIYEA